MLKLTLGIVARLSCYEISVYDKWLSVGHADMKLGVLKAG
jgi:hypothetical protein